LIIANRFGEKFELEWIGEIRVRVKMAKERWKKKKRRECHEGRRERRYKLKT